MSSSFFKNRDFIIISSIDWSTHRQLHHELISYLEKKNARVLFIENMGTRNIRFGDISRITGRLKIFIKSWGGFTSINKLLTIFSPIFIPIHGNWIFDKLNSFYISNKILNWMSFFKFKNPIIILFAPNPISLSIVKKINYDLLNYYVADNMLLSARSNQGVIKKCEDAIIKKSDVIVYTSSNLKNKFTNINKNHHFLSNGVNINRFQNINLKKQKKNKFVIGFVGSIRGTIDENLIIYLAKKFPQDQIIFVGPIVEPLHLVIKKKFKNISFLKEVSHKKIPNIMKNFDVGLLPLKTNEFTHSIFPLKLFEYLAMGIPVLSTATITMLKFNLINKNAIHLCKNYQDFEKEINRIKTNFYPKKIKINNQLLAKKNSWDIKFLDFENILTTAYFSKKNKKQSFSKTIATYYNLQKIKYIKRAIFVFISSLIFLSVTNLEIFGNVFKIDAKNKSYKNAIVITGYGHREYGNISYQYRFRDLINNNKLIDFENIIIIGRSSKVDEGRLLLSMVPEKIKNYKNIILIKDAGSAYNNVLKLKEILQKDNRFKNLKNFSVISSQAFSRRFGLIVKKNIPEIKLDFLQSESSKDKNFFSVIYEILAIIKYRLSGFL